MLRRYLIAAFCLTAAAASAAAQSPATRELAPSARLRVALIGSNPVLVTRSADGKAGGVSVVLGEFIAAKLGLPFEPVVYATPAAYTESFGKGEWDLGIGAKDASRAEKLDFSPDSCWSTMSLWRRPGGISPTPPQSTGRASRWRSARTTRPTTS
jgi:ABC-type amino acid transport substrate-binding protein